MYVAEASTDHQATAFSVAVISVFSPELKPMSSLLLGQKIKLLRMSSTLLIPMSFGQLETVPTEI